MVLVNTRVIVAQGANFGQVPPPNVHSVNRIATSDAAHVAPLPAFAA